jgi:alanine transaminase
VEFVDWSLPYVRNDLPVFRKPLRLSELEIFCLLRALISSYCCTSRACTARTDVYVTTMRPIGVRNLKDASRFSTRSSIRSMPLTVSTINPAVLKVQYAVRGELAIRAETYRERLKQPNHGLPFDKVVTANIGNPQQKGLDQPPLTFSRQVSENFCWILSLFSALQLMTPFLTKQVAALLEYPPLVDEAKDLFPKDVLTRAKELYNEIGSIGAYSHSQGIPFIRRNVAKFIEGPS